VQNDIKRVLAYSTVSQLGYMFLAMGVGAFGAGIFHLYTHAFFKACLFLGSGAVIHALHGEQDIRHMGGLKKHLPVTYWTFLIASLAIAGVPALAGFFSKDEILFDTFRHGHTALWVVGVLTSLMTATYMFRLVFLTFHGEERFDPATVGAHGHGGGHGHGHDDHGHDAHAAPASHAGHGTHGHGGHLHDAPPAMALALIVLAIGSVAAGYIGVPHALGGHNALGEWLKPVFALENTQQAPPASLNAHAGHAAAVEGPMAGDAHAAEATAHGTGAAHGDPASGETHDETALELTLMGVSSAIAFLGIGLAAFLWIRNRHIPDQMAQSFSGVHRLLLNKYYVDEAYDAAIVQPIKAFSIHGLWKVADARVIDGAVNGAGALINAAASALRLLQTGSVKTYAAGTFLGAVLLLAFFLWR
jgi:NADH-quinone oxidoreductase subunit L